METGDEWLRDSYGEMTMIMGQLAQREATRGNELVAHVTQGAFQDIVDEDTIKTLAMRFARDMAAQIAIDSTREIITMVRANITSLISQKIYDSLPDESEQRRHEIANSIKDLVATHLNSEGQ